MNRVLLFWFYFLLNLFYQPLWASADGDSVLNKSFSFGLLPAIAFDSDLGMQVGGLTNMYWYGHPSSYPVYRQSLYLEASRFSAGSTLLRSYLITDQVVRGVETSLDVIWMRDLLMDFYGFNGYQSRYWSDVEVVNSSQYISRAFYKHHRDLYRAMVNLVSPVSSQRSYLKWIAGVTLFGTKVEPVWIKRINKTANDPLPQVDGLYDKYVQWGLISDNEKNGGWNTLVKAGISIDTRDFKSSPSSGVWSEAMISLCPNFLSTQNGSFGKVTLVHSQYHSWLHRRGVFAFRLFLQQTLWGDVPFYLLPDLATTSLRKAVSQGLGGASSLRGIRRNRVTGEGIFMSNVEYRHKWVQFKAGRQSFYLATNLFSDMGMVIDPCHLNLKQVPEEERKRWFSTKQELPHVSIGFGLKVAMNENFIVSADYGKALDQQDGDSGFYINMNYLF